MLSVSVISVCVCVFVCVCVCVSEHVFSTLHLYSSTRPSFLCGNFQIYSGFIDFFLTNKKKKSISSHFPFIFNWGHIDPKRHICKKKNYIPSERPNQAQVFLYEYR